MSILYFAAIILLGCIFSISIGGIVRRQDDEDWFTPEFERCQNELNSSQINGTVESLQATFSFFSCNDDCLSAAIDFNVCSGTGDAESSRRRCTSNRFSISCTTANIKIYSMTMESFVKLHLLMD